jgi:hypothetical protein
MANTKAFLPVCLLLSCVLVVASASSSGQLHSQWRNKHLRSSPSGPSLAGRKVYGPGISDEQAGLISAYIAEASSAYQDDKFNNAIYIQDVMEKSNAFAGRWTIEIVDNREGEEWQLAGEVRNDQWFMVTDYGEYGWNYRVWTPNC